MRCEGSGDGKLQLDAAEMRRNDNLRVRIENK